MRETWARSLGREDPLEKEMAAHSSTIAYKSHGWRSLVGYSPWGCKESDMTERLHFTPWMDLETITLSEINQTQKYKYCMIPFMCSP